ncbi:MAG TPA: hypothetical protein VNU92_11040 [Edaphobacter sp.]|jgi:hypothetical protein|nr:hypothetical protein [Edaphobacter sp.]
MIFTFRTRTVTALLFATIFSFSVDAQTPAPNTTEWENESLKLRLFYSSDLAKGDTEQLLQDGQISLTGVMGATDTKAAAAARCLRPLLFLRLPPASAPQTETTQPASAGATQVTITPVVSASLLLAELDINCLNAEHAAVNTTLLDNMAEIVSKVPGMRAIAQSSTYTIGWQKIHMAAAQGQPQSGAGTAPSQLYTMGLSTNWNSHLLVWYLTSNSIDMLNRITKTTVRFGRDQASPLYPLVIGNATP